jgi:hypothetical protein
VTISGQGDAEQQEGTLRSLNANWSAVNAVEASFANAFISQIGASAASGRPDGIYLAAGHIAPPTFLGTPEEMQKHLDDLGNELQVRVHAHVVMSRDRAQELANLLIENIAKYDAAAGRPA